MFKESASTRSDTVFHAVDEVSKRKWICFNNSFTRRFVLKWCERGRGLKPDWATKGIEFLYFAANPTITRFLSDDEFLVFLQKYKILCGQMMYFSEF